MNEGKMDLIRIVLTGKEKEAYESMVEALKAQDKFIKVSPSKLVGWIVKRYFESGFSRDKDQIGKDHFNLREYLKEGLRNAQTQEEVAQVLKDALERCKGDVAAVQEAFRRKPGRKPKQPVVANNMDGQSDKTLE